MKYFIDTEFIEKPGSIELISIGIVAEDDREYYAVSKDFNLTQVWNQYDLKKTNLPMSSYRDYWLRDNVLKPIHADLVAKELEHEGRYKEKLYTNFTKKSLKNLIKWHGEHNGRIAAQVVEFCRGIYIAHDPNPEFYAYFGDYDWVVFCWLFGRMIDLPEGFPYFAMDLKQMMVERGLTSKWKNKVCPKPEDEHNALADAKWNKRLFEEIKKYD